MKVRLIAKTQGVAEAKTGQELISYVARVSNPKNQENFSTGAKLLKYCLDHGHYSVFEQAHLTFEVETSVAIATQIIRHWTLSVQQFSARYAEVPEEPEVYQARRQDTKNRQNSIDDMSTEDKDWFVQAQLQVWDLSRELYDEALQRGVAKELSRFLLPQNTRTKLYLSGDIRSWIFYLKVRTDAAAQKEHRDVATEIQKLFCSEFPDIAEALGWNDAQS